MKKNLIFTGLLGLAYAIGLSQPYGQMQIPNGSALNAGGLTGLNANNAGFITIGMKGSYIHIDKTRAGGAIPSTVGPYSFQRKYLPKTVAAAGCFSNGNDVTNCIAANVIEIPMTNYASYVMMGVYPDACFLTFLAVDGTPINSIAYPFPSSDPAISRAPVITRAASGHYYVAGQYTNLMYAMELDQYGTPVWSNYYDVNGPTFQPRGILESPFTGEVVIAGWMTPDPNYGVSSDAFFMTLDPASSGAVNVLKDYSSTPCNWFDAIKPSYAPSTGNGYIVGGYCDYNTGNGEALMMKLDLGGGIAWNTVITSGSPGIISKDVMDVVERQNSTGHYEYYGLAQTFDAASNYPYGLYDMTVFKLDETGNPYSFSHPGFDEYHYPAATGSEYMPWNLTALPVGTGHDQGLHMYVNNSGSHLIQETYFNGVMACNEQRTNILSTEQGPSDINVSVSLTSGPTNCAFGMSQLVDGYTPNVICSNNSIPFGSNQRTTVATSIAEQAQNTGLQLYPNPGNGIYTIEATRTGTVKIYSVLGELIYSGKLESGKNKLDLLKQPNGIYFAEIADGDNTGNFQFIKN